MLTNTWIVIFQVQYTSAKHVIAKHLPKDGALCSVISRMIRVPKQDHMSRNWRAVFRSVPTCWLPFCEKQDENMYVYMNLCMRACARACMHACMYVCTRKYYFVQFTNCKTDNILVFIFYKEVKVA